jgi:pyruvate/2-oxoglutarate dehydrogenase complex dihydrolipoamide acyltransferase (E2) component
VAQYEPVLEIETDKVTTEATAEEAGTLLKIYVEAGETVPVGTLLAFIGEPGEPLPGGQEAEAAPSDDKTAEPEVMAGLLPPAPRPKGANGSPKAASRRYTGRISPVVGRIAAENMTWT